MKHESKDTSSRQLLDGGGRIETIKQEGYEGYTIVSLRLRNAEFVEFSRQVREAGLTNNRALRIAARRIAGFLETDNDTKSTLQRITRNIGEITSGINAASKVAKDNKNIDLPEFTKKLHKLGKELARIEMKIQDILNVTKRRKDGLKLLRAAGGEK